MSSLFSVLARGLFSMEMPKDTQEKVEEKRYGIVKRGYDKFFNIRKDQKAQYFADLLVFNPICHLSFINLP